MAERLIARSGGDRPLASCEIVSENGAAASTDGREPSPLYVRADRGEVIGRVWADYRAFRWLGSGVHDLDFPVLFQRRPRLWSWAIQLPVVIGLLASASGLWLGISYVARAFTLRPGRPPYGARDEAREPDVAG